MKRVRLRNADRDALLGTDVAVADTFWTRLRGLLGRPPLGDGEGLLLAPSSGVHMYFMRFALDVALLDREGTVVEVYPELAPWDRTRIHRDARYALELPVGTLDATGTRTGDRLEWEDPA